MASASSTSSSFSKEKTNFTRLSRLLIDCGTKVLRGFFDNNIHPPSTLYSSLHSPTVHHILQGLRARRILNTHQWERLYPATTPVTSQSFDITLLCLLLRNICGLAPPSTGWNTPPVALDSSPQADLLRIKLYRNELYGHITTTTMSDSDFEKYWKDISDVLVRLGGPHHQPFIERLKVEALDDEEEKYLVNVIKEWNEADKQVIDKLVKVEEELALAVKEMKEQIIEQFKEIGVQVTSLPAGSNNHPAHAESTSDQEKDLSKAQDYTNKLKSSKEEEVKRSRTDGIDAESTSDQEKDLSRAQDYTKKLKSSIERQTEFLMLEGEVKKTRTKDIFTNVTIERGQKYFQENQDKRFRRAQYDHVQAMSTTLKNCSEMFIFPENDDPKSTATSTNNPKSILLTGKAGIGKSLFCRKLVRDWADNKLFEQGVENTKLPDIQFALLLTFRQLSLLEHEELDLRDILNSSSLLDEPSIVDEELIKYIIRNPEKLLIIFDGYDEYKHRGKITGDFETKYPNNPFQKIPVPALIAKIMKGNMLKESVVMISSRPGEADELKIFDFDVRCEIKGFSPLQVIEYFEKYFQDSESTKKAAIDHIKANAILLGIGHIPVMCYLMCIYIEWSITREKTTKNLPITTTRLYHEVINLFIQKHSSSKYEEMAETELQAILYKLAELAFNLMKETKIFFDENDMKRFNFSEKEITNMKASGLFDCCPGVKKSPFEKTKLEFMFSHLTLQEFLCAFFYVEIKRRLPEKEETSDVTWMFVAGLLSRKKDEQLMKKLLENLPLEHTYDDRNRVLRLQCLYEYGDDELSKASAVLTSDQEKDPSSRAQVPLEIMARGPEAQEAYQHALKEGKVQVYWGRIMLIGQDRAGKTSLKKSLLGLKFKADEPSTVGVDVDPSSFSVDVDDVIEWKKLEDSPENDVEDKIARMTADRLRKRLEDKKHEEEVRGNKPEISESETSRSNNPGLKDSGNKPESSESETSRSNNSGLEDSGNKPESSESETSRSNNSGLEDSDEVIDDNAKDSDDDDDGDAVDNGELISDQTKCEEPETATGAVNPLSKEVIENVIKYLSRKNLDVSSEDKVMVSVWDFAGQQLYYASHPVFFSHRAVYLLVYNMNKDLKAEAQPCVRQGVHDINLENHEKQTNLESILSWLVSVHCVRPEENGKSKDGKDLPYLQPPVIIVGTHADCPFEASEIMEAIIHKTLRGKGYNEHVVPSFITVDNRSADDKGIRMVKDEVKTLFKMEPYMGEYIPVRWLIFEKVIKSLVEERRMYYLPLNDLEEIVGKVCQIENKDEMEAMLNFYHDLGVIVKHGNTVVLKAEWLIDLFKRLITIKPHQEQIPRQRRYWDKLENEGILDIGLVEYVFNDLLKSDERSKTKEDILAMMEKYALIARFGTPEDFHYFVPVQLQQSPPGDIDVEPTELDPCSLYLQFPDGFIPHGLYHCLVSKLIAWCSENKYPDKPKLYRNLSKFYIGCFSEYELLLICRKPFIKVVLRSLQNERSQKFQPAFLVRTSLEKCLAVLKKECHGYRSIGYEISVRCPSYSRHDRKCDKHKQGKCRDDECLHLLPVNKDRVVLCKITSTRNSEVPGLEEWYTDNLKVPEHSEEPKKECIRGFLESSFEKTFKDSDFFCQSFTLGVQEGIYELSQLGILLEWPPNVVTCPTQIEFREISPPFCPAPAKDNETLVSYIVKLGPSNVELQELITISLNHSGASRKDGYETIVKTFDGESCNEWKEVLTEKSSAKGCSETDHVVQVKIDKLSYLAVVREMMCCQIFCV